MQSLAKALAFSQRAGLDMPQVLQTISQGATQSWQMETAAPPYWSTALTSALPSNGCTKTSTKIATLAAF